MLYQAQSVPQMTDDWKLRKFKISRMVFISPGVVVEVEFGRGHKIYLVDFPDDFSFMDMWDLGISERQCHECELGLPELF